MSRLVRTAAFARNELVATLGQPRLLATLVLGPFLVLFLFGLGYEHQLPELGMVVVGAEGQLVDDVDEYLREVDPAGLDYRGTTQDRDAALTQLRDGDVDVVVLLPDDPLAALEDDERAVIEVRQLSLDPVTDHQITIASRLAVGEINDLVLEDVLRRAQTETADLEAQLSEAREQLASVQAAVEGRDVAGLQRTAAATAERFDELASAVASSRGIVGALGLGARAGEVEDSLRSGAELLRRFATGDPVGDLQEATQALTDLEEVVTQLRAVDPVVAVRPFDVEIVNDSPVPVTLDRFFAPGLVALMLQHLALTFGALSLVRERERGTIEVLRAAPATLGERLLGKGIGFLVIGGILAAGLVALIMAAFGVPAPHSWLAFVAVVALVLLASLGYGYLIAAAARTDSQTVQLAMLAFLTAIFFSGLFMPLERIAWPVEAISWAMPATWAFRAMQQLMLLDRPAEPWLLVGLAVMAVVLLALARFTLGRRARPA